MISQIFRLLFLPIVTGVCVKKYGGIWGLKSRLNQDGNPNKILLNCYEKYLSKSGSWIGFNSRFAGLPCFPHGLYGIFISGGAKIGRNVVIFQQVTIGSNTLNDSIKAGSPTIGDNVYIGAGAKIIGNISIGDNCRIGANAVVYEDMPPNSVAVQSPTRIIQKSNLDNRFYSMNNSGWVFYRDGNWVEDNDRVIQ
jgi:serine acetyltransferase